jgi:hypothetical protein
MGGDDAGTAGIYLGSLDGSPAVRVLPDESNALYVPPPTAGRNGHLVFRRKTTLMVQSFDVPTRSVTGTPVPVADDVPSTNRDGFGAFSVSWNGALAYRVQGSAAMRELVWTDRTGVRIGRVDEPGWFGGRPAISPDERTVAVTRPVGAQVDIWLQDLQRDVHPSRLTLRAGIARSPAWSPDGTRLVYAFQPLMGYSYDIYVKPTSGNAAEEVLHGGVNAYPTDWSSDGRWITYHQQSEKTGMDLWVVPLDGDRTPAPYLQTPANEENARFAPSTGGPPRWMAYQSDETGRSEIYVQSIPAGVKYQISNAGGTQPSWRRDGSELFYRIDRTFMATPIVLGAQVQFGRPRELFANTGVLGYDVAPDGQRFLLNLPVEARGLTAPPVTVVLGWTTSLPD